MTERFEVFTVLINRISRNIRKIKNQEMAEYHLRSAHVSCLYYLYTNPGSTATDLCEKCEEDKATISRALEYLEENQFITCSIQSGKRYKAPLLLTEKGELVGKKIAEKIGSVLGEISLCLSDEELEEFYRCLSVISQRLDGLSKGIHK